MNERIQELIQMADLCAAGLMASGATEEEIQNRSKVVLANLIVKECVTVLEQHPPHTIDPEAYHYSISLIEEHFGVKTSIFLKNTL